MQYKDDVVIIQEVPLLSLNFANNYYLIENKIYQPQGPLTDMMTLIARFALDNGYYKQCSFANLIISVQYIMSMYNLYIEIL